MKVGVAMLLVGLGVLSCGGEGNGGGGADADAAGAGGGGGAVAGGGAGVGGQLGHVGDPCSEDAQCPAGGSGTPVCLTDWPEGYCAVNACEDHGHDCPEDPGLGGTATTGGKCVLNPDLACLALCATSEDCRAGYACAARPDAAGHGEALVCVPDSGGGAGGGMSSSSGSGGMMSSSGGM